MRGRSHMGRSFDVWNGNESWFWMVLDPSRNGGVIGAAATEEDAVRDACASIEEMAARAIRERHFTGEAKNRLVHLSGARTPRIIWRAALARLDRYLISIQAASA